MCIRDRLPLGDQLHRHLHGVPVPLLQHRRGQRAPEAPGHRRPEWFSDSRGLLHLFFGLFGAGENPHWAQGQIFGRSLWDWLSGPSVAMCCLLFLAVWTTTGTFMLMFLAALQDLPVEVDEAAMMDGVSPWQKLRLVTVPMLKPALFLVITFGVIGTWQVFDQI